MTRKEAIDDLIKLKEFFEERSNAYPVSIDVAIIELTKKKNGKWITRPENHLHYCSECGWALMDTESGEPPYMGIDFHRSNSERWTCCPGWSEWLMNYCPSCGSEMKGGQDEINKG